MRAPICFALLLTGLLSSRAEEPASYDREADRHGFTVFMRDGGWCWFQDPRAVVQEGKLLVGSVKGHGRGEALVGVFDLTGKRRLGPAVMNAAFDRDDHNSPVFHLRPDGRVLAVYARHNRDQFHYSRLSAPGNPLQWSEERTHERKMPQAKDKVTYMNLCGMTAEKRLYLLFRGIEFNPTFVTSTDHGDTWSKPVHFFESEVPGRHRPYARYAGNGRDTIHVAITDAHPRNFGNSLYYFAFRNGAYFRADGTKVKHLGEDGPLRPSEAELVFRGSMTAEKAPGFESVPGAAWTSAIALDQNGHPHIAYSVYLSNRDHRYRLASWDGNRWIDREVAHGGTCLYERESSYTGLIALDPVDPSHLVLSTDVNPRTGESRGGQHEIYRARIRPNDTVKTIRWEPVTRDSPVRNIRPMIVRDGTRRITLWNRGDFRTFTNYDLDTVGLIEEVAD